MDYRVIYTANKNGYVTIKGQKLLLKIPHRLKNNKKFLDALLAKGALLMKKKNHTLAREQTIDGQLCVLLFGEWVPQQDIMQSGSPDLDTCLQEILREYSQPIIDDYAQQLGYGRGKLSIRRLKTKWGSCSHTQNISLNLDLVHLPTRLVRYVLIHEVCHLQHKHHQKAFWDELEGLFPGCKQASKVLKRYRFV